MCVCMHVCVFVCVCVGGEDVCTCVNVLACISILFMNKAIVS